MGVFTKANKKRSRLRMALCGPPGSGKTYSALSIAAHLGKRVAVIDSERGSASLYSDKFNFDVIELDNFDPRVYVDMIETAAHEGYDVCVIDSLTHAWSGKGGALELVDKGAKRSGSGNSFAAWRDVTPLHNMLVDTMLNTPMHVVATMRTKMDYVLEADPRTGKLTPRKVGMAPIQREGMDYEFTVVGDMNVDHDLIVGKTRCDLIDGKVYNRPGKEIARVLLGWLDQGVEVAPKMGGLDPERIAKIEDLIAQIGMTPFQAKDMLAKRGVSSMSELSETEATVIISRLEEKISLRDWDPLAPKTIAPAEPPTVGGDAPLETDGADDHVIAETTRPVRD